MNIDWQKIPANLDEAVDILMAGIEDKDKKYLDNSDPMKWHFGLGMTLRNEWLWEPGSPLSIWFRKEYKIWHADDMSGIILDTFLAKYKNLPFDVASEVENCHNHWVRFGLDKEEQCKEIDERM